MASGRNTWARSPWTRTAPIAIAIGLLAQLPVFAGYLVPERYAAKDRPIYTGKYHIFGFLQKIRLNIILLTAPEQLDEVDVAFAYPLNAFCDKASELGEKPAQLAIATRNGPAFSVEQAAQVKKAKICDLPRNEDRNYVLSKVRLENLNETKVINWNAVHPVAAVTEPDTSRKPEPLISSLPSRPPVTGAKLHILAVGVDTDRNSKPILTDVKFAGADAKAFAETAQKAMGPLYQNVETTLLISGAPSYQEPTKENILAALKRLQTASPDDAVV